MDLDNDVYQLNVKAHSFTATHGTTTVSDFLVDEDNQYIQVGKIFTNNGVAGDYVTFEIVDKDNVLGLGEEAILLNYVKKYFVHPSIVTSVAAPYIGKVPNGVYFRFSYTSVGDTTDTGVFINLFFHTKVR